LQSITPLYSGRKASPPEEEFDALRRWSQWDDAAGIWFLSEEPGCVGATSRPEDVHLEKCFKVLRSDAV
jgi:hypothetical protein